MTMWPLTRFLNLTQDKGIRENYSSHRGVILTETFQPSGISIVSPNSRVKTIESPQKQGRYYAFMKN